MFKLDTQLAFLATSTTGDTASISTVYYKLASGNVFSGSSFDIYVDSVGGEDGTAVGDVILTDNYSEFTSKLRNLATPVVADDITMSVNNETGYAIVVKAA